MFLPKWVRVKIKEDRHLKVFLKKNNIITVCETLRCPNKAYCYRLRTITFMILGDRCTRKCSFCNSKKLPPEPPNQKEPQAVAKVVKELSMKYVVITSPTRDDLIDGGAMHYIKTIDEIKSENPKTLIEVLVPDFKGDKNAIRNIIFSDIVVFSHNLETVKRLYSFLRDADYSRSLEILAKAKEIRPEVFTKSGIMLGVGETLKEVFDVLRDLRKVDCDIVTIGQYLQPTKNSYRVVEYINPEVFNKIADFALDIGFRVVLSSPLMRSSTKAYEAYMAMKEGKYGKL